MGRIVDINISQEVKSMLDLLKKEEESYNDTLKRILSSKK
jgi:predicted CopG family antitoxin